VAEHQGRQFDEEVFEDAQGNLFVFRDGDFQPTTRQALETGAVEAAAVGAGATLTNIAGTVSDFVTRGDAAATARAEDERLLAPLEAEQGLAVGAGRAAPFIIGGAATAGAGLPAIIGAEAALGALEARPGERLQGAALGAGGAALGGGLATVTGRTIARNQARAGRRPGQVLDQVDEGEAILQPPPRAAPEAPAPKLTRAQGRAQAFEDIDTPRAPPGAAVGASARAIHGTRVGQADDLGFQLTAGERVNSSTLRQVEAGFRSSPFAPSNLRDVKAANQVNLNAKWGEAIGVGPVQQIDDTVMGEAFENAQNAFVEAAELAGTVDTRGLGGRVRAIREPRGASLIQDDAVERLLGTIEELAARGPRGAGVAARDFMATRSMLNKQMRDASNQGQGVLAEALQDVIQAMDETFEAGAGEAAAAIYKGARENWRFITALERGQTLNTATGNVNARTAGTSLRRMFKQEAGRGGAGDLSEEGARAIESTQVANYFGDIVGDSGTATRMSVQNIVQNPAGAIGGAVTRALGEGYNRIVAPVVERASRGQRGGAGLGPDIGGLGGLGGQRGALPLDL